MRIHIGWDGPGSDESNYEGSTGLPWAAIIVATILIAIMLVSLTMAILAVLPTPAAAHDWYSGYQNAKKESCCGGSDCAQLPDDAVHAVKGGYEVSYLPSGFPNAIEIKAFPIVIANANAQPGEDPVHYHLCIWGSEAKCFFVPAPGF